MSLAAPLSAGRRGKCVHGSSRAHYRAQVSDRCDSGQSKTHTFSKKKNSAYHKHPVLMQPVCTAVSTPCHAGRLILDLRLLNYALMKRSFRMITWKQILPQICPGDWFMSLDLKDAYFHIQVGPHHRQLLRFAFEGVAYQYKVLQFRLSLASRTFTRCMDASLSSLRQMGIRILNYLDDWLILAQSQAVLHLHLCNKQTLLSKATYTTITLSRSDSARWRTTFLCGLRTI